jgi:anaerobic magnesium-protoporphyrin IX monomethyl ester cyclase
VKVADLVLVKDAVRYVKDVVRFYRPDIVGFSCMTFQYPTAVALAKVVKEVDRSIKVVFGGYHPTITYREPQPDCIDFIVRGEGEQTFHELILALKGKMRMEDVSGLSFRSNGDSFRHNEPRAHLNLDTLKIPDRGARILKGFHAFGRPLDVVETSRGCTLDCKYCCILSMYGRRFRTYRIGRVLEDIYDAIKHGAKSIFFVDDNITLNRKRFRRICEAIIDHGLNHLHYHIQASVHGLAEPDTIQIMAKAGFKVVFLGIESMIHTDLSFLSPRKSDLYTSDTVFKIVKKLREEDIIVIGGFMLGNPEDSEVEFWHHLEQARRLKIDLPIFFLSTPYPGTELREELKKLGLLTNPDDYSKYTCFEANIKTKNLSPEDIDELEWQLYHEWYNTIGWFFWNNLKKHYPLYTIKAILKTYPKHLLNALGVAARFKPYSVIRPLGMQ